MIDGMDVFHCINNDSAQYFDIFRFANDAYGSSLN